MGRSGIGEVGLYHLRLNLSPSDDFEETIARGFLKRIASQHVPAPRGNPSDVHLMDRRAGPRDPLSFKVNRRDKADIAMVDRPHPRVIADEDVAFPDVFFS
jgi:hypothetical protein